MAVPRDGQRPHESRHMRPRHLIAPPQGRAPSPRPAGRPLRIRSVVRAGLERGRGTTPPMPKARAAPTCKNPISTTRRPAFTSNSVWPSGKGIASDSTAPMALHRSETPRTLPKVGRPANDERYDRSSARTRIRVPTREVRTGAPPVGSACGSSRVLARPARTRRRAARVRTDAPSLGPATQDASERCTAPPIRTRRKRSEGQQAQRAGRADVSVPHPTCAELGGGDLDSRSTYATVLPRDGRPQPRRPVPPSRCDVPPIHSGGARPLMSQTGSWR